ncbi:1-phosphofructokinase [Paenibacillus sp. M1]|uniref:Tagatose-6-phosphate kinase n=1 Tax=Paenibacillus haidiansis TaxID=1574488 RepID=A0ABU7VYG8_9BACL
MIYTMTLNPSIDYIVEVKDLQLGGLNRMSRDLKLPGGKGINVSRILSRLGVPNTALGFAGGFTGRYIEDKLREERVRADFVPITGDTRINIKLKAGEETEINGLGPAISAGESAALLQKLTSGLRAEDIVVMSGSVPPSLGGGFYDELVGLCETAGAGFVIDTTGEALLRALSHRPLLVKPNHHELAELFGVRLDSEEVIIACGRRLLELGARHALISMAEQGAFLVAPEAVYCAQAPAGTARNSAGAGDSMIAGFLAGLTRGEAAVEAFRTGVAAGSATAFSDDLATREQIEELRRRVEPARVG